MPRRLELDRLATPELVQVRRLDRAQLGGERVREPHRHDYHELLWLAAGAGEQAIDGVPSPVVPGTLTVIGRGQVHVFERGEGITGAVVRFGEELVSGGAARIVPAWLLAGRGGLTVPVPPSERPRLDALVGALEAETARPPDARTGELQRHLVSVLLLWVERWADAARIERVEADDAALRLHRRFAEALERDFARHHDAAHYADVLGVPAAALSRALTAVTGRGTKELVLDRVMVEAARLLRFTELTVGQVAFEVGFEDPFHFSRAFKRARGVAPSDYRMSMHR